MERKEHQSNMHKSQQSYRKKVAWKCILLFKNLLLATLIWLGIANLLGISLSIFPVPNSQADARNQIQKEYDLSLIHI